MTALHRLAGPVLEAGREGAPQLCAGCRRTAVTPPAGRVVDAGQAGHEHERMKVTYYLEVLSSWCHWVEPTWAELKARYAGRAEFEWRIALMNPEDFPVSQSQCDWFYRRSGGTVMN